MAYVWVSPAYASTDGLGVDVLDNAVDPVTSFTFEMTNVYEVPANGRPSLILKLHEYAAGSYPAASTDGVTGSETNTYHGSLDVNSGNGWSCAGTQLAANHWRFVVTRSAGALPIGHRVYFSCGGTSDTPFAGMNAEAYFQVEEVKVLWCGGEDTDFDGAITTGTSAYMYRGTYARGAISSSSGSAGRYARTNFDGGSKKTFWMRFWFYNQNVSSSTDIKRLAGAAATASNHALCVGIGGGSGSGYACAIQTTDGTSGGTTTLASDDGWFTDVGLYCVDLQVENFGATGTARVYVNESLAVEYTGNLVVGGITSLGRAVWYPSTNGHIFSEFCVQNGDTRGLVGVKTLHIIDFGHSNTAASGTVGNIDEVSLSTADYIRFNASGQAAQAVYDALPVDTIGVRCVRVSSHIVASGGGLTFQHGLRVSGANYVYNFTPLTTYQTFDRYFATNPATSGDAWTPADVYASELAFASNVSGTFDLAKAVGFAVLTTEEAEEDGDPAPDGPLTLSDALTSHTIPLIGVVTIFSAVDTFSWVTGKQPLFGFPNSVSKITSFGATLDEFSRSVTLSGATITMVDDGTVRELAAERQLIGKELWVRIGTTDMLLENYETRFDGFIRSILPTEDGGIVIEVDDWLSSTSERTLEYDEICMHPSGHALKVLTDLEIPSTRIDTDSFVGGPNDLQFNFSRTAAFEGVPSYPITAAVPANKLLGGILAGAGGAFIECTPAGVLTWRPYDANALPLLRITEDDYFTVRQIEPSEICNRYTVQFLAAEGRVGAPIPVYTEYYNLGRGVRVAESTDVPFRYLQEKLEEPSHSFSSSNGPAQTALALPGISTRIVEQSETNEWLMAESSDGNASAIPSSGPFDFDFGDACIFGFCGARTDGVTNTFLAPPSDVNPVYLAIGFMGPGGTFEIVRANAIEQVGSSTVSAHGKTYPQLVQYSVVERGLFGTEETEHPDDAPVADFTIPILTAQAKVARFGYGPPRLEVIAAPHLLTLPLGAFVSIEYDDLIYKQATGDSTNWVWELVERDENLFDDMPHVRLVLAYVRAD